MKIITKLQVIIAANILILAGLVCMGLLWQKQTGVLIEQNTFIAEFQKAVFERARLREEYFLHRTDRAKNQFLIIHKEIGGRLDRISKLFQDPEEKASLDAMITAHLKIGQLFDSLIRLDEQNGNPAAGIQEIRERIISQMLVNAHVMHRDGLKLLEAVNEKSQNQNRLTRLYGYVAFGFLASLIGAFAVIIMRSIAHPLARLHKGMEWVARGNLDYRTDIGSRDEIGRLSRSFDAMTEDLQRITVSRDKLNEEISGRKRTEEELRAIYSYKESLLTAIPDIIMEVDANKVYTWANQPGRDFFGEDVVGKEAAFFFEGEQDTYAAVAPLFAGDETLIRLESWQRRRDGEKRLLSWRCRVLKDENGQVTGALSSARDITEQQRTEEALRASEENFRRSLDESPLGIRVITIDGHPIYSNKKALDLFGYDSFEEMQNTPTEKRYTPESYAVVLSNREKGTAARPMKPNTKSISSARMAWCAASRAGSRGSFGLAKATISSSPATLPTRNARKRCCSKRRIG